MKILALDTTAKTASVALAEGQADGGVLLLGETYLRTGAHSTTLLPMIESLLKINGMTAADLGLIAATTGPGSFTGVRIGVSTAKGLAFVQGTPCVGVSALEVFAEGLARNAELILPALDARRGTVYTAAFLTDGNGNVTRLMDDAQMEWTDYLALAERLSLEYPGRTRTAAGDALDLPDRELPNGFRRAPVQLDAPTGYGAACAAYRIYRTATDRTVFTDAALNPVYLKKSQAEREREERLMMEPNG